MSYTWMFLSSDTEANLLPSGLCATAHTYRVEDETYCVELDGYASVVLSHLIRVICECVQTLPLLHIPHLDCGVGGGGNEAGVVRGEGDTQHPAGVAGARSQKAAVLSDRSNKIMLSTV